MTTQPYLIRATDAPPEMPAPLHVTHGPEVQATLEALSQRQRVIWRLTTIIVVLSVVLSYCLEWARLHGL